MMALVDENGERMLFETKYYDNVLVQEGYYDEDGDFISTKTIPQGNDGILVETTNQLDTSKEFVAINSNQIKSVDNQGVFST